jgi:hypothetical protein
MVPVSTARAATSSVRLQCTPQMLYTHEGYEDACCHWGKCKVTGFGWSLEQPWHVAQQLPHAVSTTDDRHNADTGRGAGRSGIA